ARRGSIRAREETEHVVEAAVLLDDEHEVLDRRRGGEARGVHSARPRRGRRAARRRARAQKQEGERERNERAGHCPLSWHAVTSTRGTSLRPGWSSRRATASRIGTSRRASNGWPG